MPHLPSPSTKSRAISLAAVNAQASFWNPPFPEKHLFDGEEVVVDLKPHWWHFAKSFSAMTVSAVATIWAANWDDSNFAETWGSLLLRVLFACSVIWLGVRWLKWRSTHFVVTTDRVVFRSGVVVKRGIAIPLERVNNINFHQSLWERAIRAGDLEIESAGQDGQQLFFDIRRPDAVQSLIHAQIEENDLRSRGSAGRSTDRATQLERLEGLRNRGTLSAEEFEKEKLRLLEGE